MEGLVFKPIPDLDTLIPIRMSWRVADDSQPVALFIDQMRAAMSESGAAPAP